MTRGAVSGFAIVAALAAGFAHSEVSRELRLSIPVSGSVTVENLAGRMTIVPGDGDELTIVATVHAESEELAATVRLAEVGGPINTRTVRVIYPTSKHRRFSYPHAGRSQVEYGGERVTVSGTGGVLLWAEVAVTVPRRDVDATFRNLVGTLSGEGLSGRILLDAAAGDIHGRNLAGKVTADTGSGDVLVEASRGSLVCDTGSGSCEVRQFDGDRVRCDTGSGTIDLADVRATRVEADAGSGDIRSAGLDAEDITVSTGSGSVELGIAGTRLARAQLDTGSGDVELSLPPDAAFELLTDIGSGDLVCRFADARATVEHRLVVGYTRGSGGALIDVDTGSGSVIVRPAT